MGMPANDQIRVPGFFGKAQIMGFVLFMVVISQMGQANHKIAVFLMFQFFFNVSPHLLGIQIFRFFLEVFVNKTVQGDTNTVNTDSNTIYKIDVIWFYMPVEYGISEVIIGADQFESRMRKLRVQPLDPIVEIKLLLCVAYM